MSEEKKWRYEKLNPETGKLELCPMNDLDGTETGKIILNVHAYFDENPDERIRLGWTKHIEHDAKDMDYNPQSQYLVHSLKQVDDYTVEDVYHVMDKTEDMMLLEELLETVDYASVSLGGITFY